MAKAGASPLVSRFGNRANALLKHRIIGRSFGEEGSGKTHFWLGAPGPIVVQSLDQGLEGVALDEYAKKDVHVIEYDWQPTDALEQDEAVEIRNRIVEDYEYALKHARTILWDKETLVWEVFRYAEFGAPNDAPRNYPALNQRYVGIINKAKATDVNFGLIQSMKDKWETRTVADRANGGTKEKGVNTGRREPSGFGDLGNVVHVNLHHRREAGKFYIDVGKARGPASTSIQDVTFGPMDDESAGMSFVEFAQMVFPDTTEEDWQ